MTGPREPSIARGLLITAVYVAGVIALYVFVIQVWPLIGPMISNWF